MGARIYYYPDATGTIETIDLTALSRLEERPSRDRRDSPRLSGGRVVVADRPSFRVRIQTEGITSAATVRQLLTLHAHIERGGVIGVSGDSAKSWCGYIRRPPSRGDTSVLTGGDVWYETAPALADGDEVIIESPAPAAIREWQTISGTVTASTRAITLGAGMIYSITDQPVWIRYRDFYPALRWPEDEMRRPIITSDHRIAWTLDMTLEVDLDAMAAAVSYDSSPWRQVGGALGASRGRSWESVLNAAGAQASEGMLPLGDVSSRWAP